MAINASGATAFQRRISTGGGTASTSGSAPSLPYWVRLVRQSSTLTAYSSADGASWTRVGSASVPMASTVYAGIAVTSHTTALTSSAGVDHVVVRTPQ